MTYSLVPMSRSNGTRDSEHMGGAHLKQIEGSNATPIAGARKWSTKCLALNFDDHREWGRLKEINPST